LQCGGGLLQGLRDPAGNELQDPLVEDADVRVVRDVARIHRHAFQAGVGVGGDHERVVVGQPCNGGLLEAELHQGPGLVADIQRDEGGAGAVELEHDGLGHDRVVRARGGFAGALAIAAELGGDIGLHRIDTDAGNTGPQFGVRRSHKSPSQYQCNTEQAQHEQSLWTSNRANVRTLCGGRRERRKKYARSMKPEYPVNPRRGS
jgi:hypothetical protein